MVKIVMGPDAHLKVCCIISHFYSFRLALAQFLSIWDFEFNFDTCFGFKCYISCYFLLFNLKMHFHFIFIKFEISFQTCLKGAHFLIQCLCLPISYD